MDLIDFHTYAMVWHNVGLLVGYTDESKEYHVVDSALNTVKAPRKRLMHPGHEGHGNYEYQKRLDRIAWMFGWIYLLFGFYAYVPQAFYDFWLWMANDINNIALAA